MAPSQNPAFGTSQLVHKWLSHVEQDLSSVSPNLDREAKSRHREQYKGKTSILKLSATLLTWCGTVASRIQHPPSGTASSNRVRHGDETHRVGSAKDRRGKAGRNAPVEPKSFSGDDDPMEQALTWRVTGGLRRHKNSTEDPGEKYARRPRNKTKEDRYDYKDIPETSSKKQQSKSGVKKKPGAILNEEFQAPNVATERLTLPSTGPGFLSKGKASGGTEWKDLPDLTFSEMRFLKRKREDDNARFQRTRDAHPKKKSSKAPNQEISDFFSRPEISKDETTSDRKPPSMVSNDSWSISPPQRPVASTGLRSSIGAHSGQGRRIQVGVRNDLSIYTSISPNSSVSNRFFGDLTKRVLLHGVDTFTPRQRIYYSLEDLRVLAQNTTAGSPRVKETLDKFYILRNDNRPTTALQASSDDTMRRHDKVRRMPAVDLVDSTSSNMGEKRYPVTQARDPTYTAEYKPQQDPYEPAAPNTTPNISFGNMLGSHQEQLFRIPKRTRNITIPGKNELDLLLSYAQIPLSQLVRLSDQNQFIEEGDRADTISVPRVRQQPDFVEGRKLAANPDERRVRNDVELMQLGLPLAAELSIADHWMQGTDAIGAFTPTSDVMDGFDENLLQDIAEGSTSGKAMGHGDNHMYDGSRDLASRDANGHWFQSDLNIDDHEQPAYGPVSMQYQQGTMVDKCIPNQSRFPETAHRVDDNSTNMFNGFSQGQILY